MTPHHSRSSLKLLSPSSTSASLFLHSLFTHQGLQVDDETEVFLGKFTFNVEKSEIQTFHLQVCVSGGEGAKRMGQQRKTGEKGSPWDSRPWHDPFVSLE